MSPRSLGVVDGCAGTHSFIGGCASSFGGAKDISFLAGVALLVNNITGPGVPQLPNLFAESGWLIPVLCCLAIWAMTSLSAAMYCEAMRHIPGNEHFQGRVEYTTIVKYYFGRRGYMAAQIGLNGALQSLNIVSVIMSAQVMDNTLAAMFGKTCGFNLTPFRGAWTDDDGLRHDLAQSTKFFSCIDTSDITHGNAWGCHVVLSLGYVIVAAMAIPCGRWNLDDNMLIQTVSLFLTILCWNVWACASLSAWETGQGLPAINTDKATGSQTAVLGTLLFNFGFVTTVPSWVNEKRPDVSVNKSVWLSSFLCVLVFLVVGISGAASFSDVLQGPTTDTCPRNAADKSFNCANDLMELLQSPELTPWKTPLGARMLQMSVYMYPIVAVITSIPVFSIVIKYNLIENGFSGTTAFLWAVVFPWCAGFPLLYMPDALGQFVNFTSLAFVSFTDFIVPWTLYIILMNKEERGELVHRPSEPGVLEHCAFPRSCQLSPKARRYIAALFAAILTALSVAAAIISVTQGNYTINEQVCALVGS